MRDFLDERHFFRGLRLAAAATVLTVPALVYSFFVSQRGFVEERIAPEGQPWMFAREIVLIFVALLISSTAGFAWSKGRRVVGFGDWRVTLRQLWWIVPAGIGLGVLIAHFIERPVLHLTGGKESLNPFSPLRAAAFEEVVCRFGMFSIGYRLSRSPTIGIVVATLFNVLMAMRGIVVVPMPLTQAQLWIQVAKQGILALALGIFYVRQGLLSTMALRFAIQLNWMYLASV